MLPAVSASTPAVLVALAAGIAAAVQVAVTGTFGRRIGVVEASAFGAVLAALLLLTLVALTRQGLGGVTAGLREPVWLWLNGVMSAVFVVSATYAAPRVGALATIALTIAGQLAVALVIDALGLFGTERIPFTAARVAGLALLAAGSFLVLSR